MKASSEMRKFKHFTLGGIQQKIFNLVLIMIILVIAAYSVVIFHQINAISGLVTETNDKQKASITETSKKTMDAVIAQSLTTSTQLQAQIANDMFSDTANAVSTIGDYAKMLFEAPEGREAHEVALPDAAKDGTACVQLLMVQAPIARTYLGPGICSQSIWRAGAIRRVMVPAIMKRSAWRGTCPKSCCRCTATPSWIPSMWRCRKA